MDSRQLKDALVADLLANVTVVDTAVPYSVSPDELDERDGFDDHLVCIYEGQRRPNVTYSSTRVLDFVQEYSFRVYGRTQRMKGSESNFESFFDTISDEVYRWAESLAQGNRIYTVSDGELRVPNSADQATSFFLDKEEEISIGTHTYTTYHFQLIRKNLT